MSRLSDIAAQPTLQQFAQGAAQENTAPVADFLAPTVDVAVPTGKYKIYTEENRFKVPHTERAIGGRAVELGWNAEDGDYNCRPHALDFPVDEVEQDAAMENALQEGAQMIAQAASLAHEYRVVSLAQAAAGAATALTWDADAKPIDDLDTWIKSVALNANYGSLMGIGMIFGIDAWQIFKNHANVAGKYVVGNQQTAAKVAVPTLAGIRELFLGNVDIRLSMMALDTAAQGKPKSLAFLMGSEILVFARMANPTRRDPSFMKTFRLSGKWMVPGTYERDDGRVEVAKFDWSEDVKVTNATAVKRLSISTGS